MPRAQRFGVWGFAAWAAFAAGALGAHAQEQAGGVTVLTALPVTYSLASTLAAGTRITVRNVPDNGRRMGAQQNYFAVQAPKLAEQFAGADAVVTIGKLWQDDPLFVAARSANIRIVDIDATKPWSDTLEGVSVAFEPQDDAPWSEHETRGAPAPSVYFWLSPSNGARAAEIVGQDLMRLAPQDAPKIAENLAAYRRELLDLKRDYEAKLAALPDVTVYALGPGLVYLLADMSIFVDGYFLKQDINWTEDDLANFSRYLKEREIKVVVHQWEPSEAIKSAIRGAGATLAVLDLGDAGIVEEGHLVTDGYLRLLRANLGTLYEALLAANR
jgi:ABC-type Zn uptake system ZnuABC Zn-binding protein ZnuA